jgi:hypothetical protein
LSSLLGLCMTIPQTMVSPERNEMSSAAALTALCRHAWRQPCSGPPP